MKRINLIILLVILAFPVLGQVTRTIDHTTADIHGIPDNWIDSAKANLDIVYWRASHGTHLTYGGMTALMRYSPEFAELYNFNEHGGEGVLKIVEFPMDLEHQNDTWVATTEAYLDTHPEVNTVMWAWCSIVDHVVELDIDQYLADMEMLISKYGPGGSENRANPVTFVFMNGHTYPYPDLGEATYDANMKIRDYCEENNHWFYDFYDLECFDPDENYFGDGTPERGSWNGEKRLRWDMSYDLIPGVSDNRGNWGIEWIEANPDTELALLSADDVCLYCVHSDGDGGDNNSRLHCVLKGQAAWWLWARLAGWQHVAVTEIIVTGEDGVTTIDVDNGTLQMEAQVLPEEASDKRVTWRVDNGTGEATISSSGLLTAVSNGTVSVVAISADGQVSGDCEVTISNQSATGIINAETDPEIQVFQNSILINLKQDPLWKDASLKVISYTGSEIYAAPLEYGSNQIEIQSDPGIYILIIQSTEEIRSRKVFIE